MRKALIGSIAVLFIVGFFAPSVMADILVKFRGGIGVNPVSKVAGNPGGLATDDAVRNDVREVGPGGQPWVIRKFKANVHKDGDIKAKGKGLVLAGGEGIGTRGGVTMVAATLFCDDPANTFTSHSSGAITLEPNGDFEIEDTLDNLPLPDPCDDPVLLIRGGSSTGPWIAAGIPSD